MFLDRLLRGDTLVDTLIAKYTPVGLGPAQGYAVAIAREVVLLALGASVLILGDYVAFPAFFSAAVPVSGLPLAILLLAAVYGAIRGLASLALLVAAWNVGAPVLAPITSVFGWRPLPLFSHIPYFFGPLDRPFLWIGPLSDSLMNTQLYNIRIWTLYALAALVTGVLAQFGCGRSIFTAVGVVLAGVIGMYVGLFIETSGLIGVVQAVNPFGLYVLAIDLWLYSPYVVGVMALLWLAWRALRLRGIWKPPARRSAATEVALQDVAA